MQPEARESALDASGCEDGVDQTLIRWMLSLTPAERLDILEQTVNGILEIRERNPEI